MTNTKKLLSPLDIGPLILANRVLMAPMTRSRSAQPGDIPTALNAEYYGQRASAGLVISEGIPISPGAKGYAYTPGIYTDAQQAGWKRVTDRVHANGGLIAAQLWHVGRIAHHSVLPPGQAPLAPSAIRARSKTFAFDENGVPAMVDCDPPQALSEKGIAAVIEEFVQAAKRAMAAGFDLVELHGANGYLLEQFLSVSTNQRTDGYGGTLENRARFVLEVVDAVSAAIGAERVGIRLSPWCPPSVNDMDFQVEARDITLYLAAALSVRHIAYLHLAEWPGAPYPPGFRNQLRSAFTGAIIVCGGYQQDSAQALLEQELIDAVAFGKPFIANPDLPRRFALGASLAEPDGSTFYGGDARGYTDYPSLPSRS
ncbi:alkene reductase [Pseudomonas chlororaphis]|uniref:Alkene reductase n=1 Tax=Pseudomonas chlororaphis TaxID=587753 RepID=A0A1Q8ER49_9PSED|nr:alkene reductase [Pseudomonas chlororaphis]OLF54277.1 alkene reductase [Pseudomonas chlororaphis]